MIISKEYKDKLQLEDNTLEKLISAINEIDLEKEVYEDEKNKKNSEVEDKENNDMKNLKDVIYLNDNFNVEELNSSKMMMIIKILIIMTLIQYLKKIQRMVLIYVFFQKTKSFKFWIIRQTIKNNAFDKYKEIILQLKKISQKKGHMSVENLKIRI